MFYTKLNRPEKVYEDFTGVKSKVETAGYLSAQKRIENMMLAGQRLVTARKEMYDFAPDQDIDESLSDPTRSPNFDMADASQIALEMDSKLRSEEQNKKKVSEEVKDVEPTEKGSKVADGGQSDSNNSGSEGDL